MSARCIALRNALVAAINGASDLLPVGVEAVGLLYASLKSEELGEAMQVVVVPGETAIERVARDAMQHDETTIVALQLRVSTDAEAEAALLVYANVTDFLASQAADLLGGEFGLMELERAAHYDAALMAQHNIVRTLIKATYRSIA